MKYTKKHPLKIAIDIIGIALLAWALWTVIH
jgi:hypothetical protein